MTADPTTRPADHQAWEPVNDVERTLADAVRTNDTRAYFQVISFAELFLPRQLTDPADAPRLYTVPLFGHTFIPVFTSEQGVADVFTGVVDGCALTNYAELRRKWPDPQWRLAINPGTPIDAYVRIEAVEAAALGDIEIPLAIDAVGAEMKRDASPAEPILDSAPLLHAAAERGDVEAYMSALADAVLIVPTARPVEDAAELFDASFPWVRRGTPPIIETFTSLDAYRRLVGGTGPTLPVATGHLAMVWPEGCSLLLDPGTQHGIELTEEQVRGLSLWTDADADSSEESR